MAITARAWSGDDDLLAMQALVSRSWLTQRPLVVGTPGDLEWWIAQDPEFDGTRSVRLWLDGRELVGWAYLRPPSEIEWHLAPGLAGGPVHEAMLDWLEHRAAEEALAGTTVDRTTIWAMETETAAPDLYERRGYLPTDTVMSHWVRHLADPVASLSLPPGYRLRTVRWPDDLEARVEVHRAAFHPSRMVMERYVRLAQRPGYAPDRDWVVEAPDGSFAAFAIAWWDPMGRVGELEPVGTHPAHRRLGLGRAVCLAAMRSLADLGAEDVLIFSIASNAASEALYASTGARVVTRSRQFARPADLQSPP